ncbi:unnamed protein product [Eretmochelys imbricata]
MGCQLLCRNEEPGPVESVFKFPVDAEGGGCRRLPGLAAGGLDPGPAPGEEAQELYGDGATRYVLPTVLHPRYTPHSETHRSPCASATCPTGWDGENITQEVPRVLQGELPYTLSRSAMLQSPHGIDHVLSNCPLTPLSYTAGNLTTAQVSLAQAPPWDRELELLVYYTEPPKPSAVLEAGLPGAEPGAPDGRPSRDDDPAAQSARGGAGPEPAGEFVLLLGRSSSTACPMDTETCLASASTALRDETLVLLLKSLPLGCYFNIYGFGSEFESFYPQSVENTQQTKAESLQRLQLLQANLGGTEILEPLRAVYRSPCRDGHPRQLFVFTDGEVENTQDIIAEDPQVLLLRHWGRGLHGSDQRHCSGSRGQRQVHHRTGPHAAQGPRCPGPPCVPVPRQVPQSLKWALQLAVTGISLSWDLPPGIQVELLHWDPEVIFAGQQCLVYAQLRGQPQPPDIPMGGITLQYHIQDQTYKETPQFSLQPQDGDRLPVHRLAAKSLLLELERAVGAGSEGDARRALEASLSSGIFCSLTAYMGVDMERGQLVRWDVPLAAPKVQRRPSPPSQAPVLAPWPPKAQPGGPNTRADSPAIRGPHRRRHPRTVKGAGKRAPEESPLLRLVSLQNADVLWNLDPWLAAVLGVSETDARGRIPSEDVTPSIWATVLAMVWLHDWAVG